MAAHQALHLARSDARAQALTYSWGETADLFIQNLHVNTTV
jgi:hypothetical protein